MLLQCDSNAYCNAGGTVSRCTHLTKRDTRRYPANKAVHLDAACAALQLLRGSRAKAATVAFGAGFVPYDLLCSFNMFFHQPTAPIYRSLRSA